MNYKGELNEKDLNKALNSKNIDRLDFTVDSANIRIIYFLIKNSCYFSSSKSVYEYNEENIDFKSDFIKSAKIKDADDIAAIAINEFSLDRYRNDPYLDKSKIKILYREWIKNNIKERCKDVLIYKENNTIHGFLCIIDKPSYYYIELVGVKRGGKKKGVGTALIRAALSKFPDKKAICVTQIHNIPMQRLLQKNRFKIVENKYVLTKHFTK
jgi:ribosomal protein S18 acetylase RimI-like enzyme